MKVKNILAIITVSLFFILSNTTIWASAYVASSLHNSVSRSETVENLYDQQWNNVQDQEIILEIFSKINWTHNFKIKALDLATKDSVVVPMNLVRTYGSVILNYPLLSLFMKNENYGFFEPRKFIIGFTTAGYHYGLTRKVSIDRGSAGIDSTSDYKYSQFFDDIYAFNIGYNPFFLLHCGWLVNKQIEPSDDGSISYFDSSKTNKTTRFYGSLSLFNSTNFSLTVSPLKSLESTALSIRVNNLIVFFLRKPLPKYLPTFIVGYKGLKLYNDADYDAVWVNSIKEIGDTKEQATLHTFKLGLEEKLGKRLFFDLGIDFQYCPKKLIEKRTNQTLNLATVRDFHALAGFYLFNFGHNTTAKGSDKITGSIEHYLLLSLGYSYFWDPAIAVHSDKTNKYAAHGFVFNADWTFKRFEITKNGKKKNYEFGANFKTYMNYAPELQQLVESVDKLSLEASLYCGF